jgi:hypothetical protein
MCIRGRTLEFGVACWVSACLVLCLYGYKPDQRMVRSTASKNSEVTDIYSAAIPPRIILQRTIITNCIFKVLYCITVTTHGLLPAALLPNRQKHHRRPIRALRALLRHNHHHRHPHQHPHQRRHYDPFGVLRPADTPQLHASHCGRRPAVQTLPQQQHRHLARLPARRRPRHGSRHLNLFHCGPSRRFGARHAPGMRAD